MSVLGWGWGVTSCREDREGVCLAGRGCGDCARKILVRACVAGGVGVASTRGTV